MPRGPNIKAQKAKELYNQGMKLVDIAKQLEVPDGTVRRWKSTYKWDNVKSERSDKNKANVRKVKKAATDTKIADEVEEISNSKLTDKQKLFCIYYIRCFNATKAYQKAYGCGYEVAAVSGFHLLRNPKIKEEILKLKQNKLNREFFTESDLFQKYMDIANASITDYVEFSKNNINLKDSKDVDGTLVSEVSKGKDGIKVKLPDRLKAMQWLSDHMDLATKKQKAEIAVLKAKLETPEDDTTDDGFIDALNGEAEEDWSEDEETESDI
ncbi:MAG: terminase small subunit [Lachnospiraceae bacterium]|nr:terminase small subunit [Lachnospiraceae bacterium]